MRKLVISILHYNNSRDTASCLRSLLRQDLDNTEIETYVLDNGSNQKFNINEDEFSKIGLKIVRVRNNLGFTGGHNYIFEKISAKNFDYFLILNNDSVLKGDAISCLIHALTEKDAGASVPKIYFTRGREYHKNRYSMNELGKVIWYAGGRIDWKNIQSVHKGLDIVDNGEFDTTENVEFATGACLLIKKEVIKKTGLFDNKYFLYYEDADLSMRISQAGYKIFYQPNAIVWHNNAGSSASGSELHDYYLTRNRLIFGLSYASLKMKILLLAESIRILNSGRKWQKAGVRDFFLRRFGKGSFISK